MTKKRSPNFPHIPLPEAIQKIAEAYPKAHRAKADRAAVAGLFGYSGINGKSSTVLGALSHFGLLEGRKDEIGISADGETLVIEPPGSALRHEALNRCLRQPKVFAETLAHFDDQLPADEMLRPFLIRKGYSPTAANALIRSLRESVDFVTAQKHEGTPTAKELDAQEDSAATADSTAGSTVAISTSAFEDTLTLTEGQVVIRCPRQLSERSVKHLEVWLKLQFDKVREGSPTSESSA